MKTDPNEVIGYHKLEANGCVFDQGLTKREYFSAMAIMGKADRQGDDYDSVAKYAVMLADTLIEELNKEAR